MVCPSDPVSGKTGIQIGGSNYYANRGDQYYQWDFPSSDAQRTAGRARGPFTRDGENLSYTSDGLSNTLFILEVSGGIGNSTQVRQGFVRNTANSQLERGYNMNPIGCYQLNQGGQLNVPADRLIGNFYTGGGTPPEEPNSLPGLRWNDGRSLFSQAFAILPPNSPRCAASQSGSGAGSGSQDYRMYNFIGAGSYHTGGVNVGFGDGSVRFASEAVDWGGRGLSPKDAGVTGGANSETYAGKSVYGVWGALGSAWAGDSGSL